MGRTLGPRFGLESVLLLLVSCYELSCMFSDEVWRYDHRLYRGKFRDAVYVYCRGAVLFLTIAWWYAADTRRGQKWIREQRGTVAVCFVATYCLSAFLLYISYDAFVCSDTKNYRMKNDFYKNGYEAPHDQIYMLNFLLIFFFMSQQHAMLFWPSLSFVAVACTIAVLDPILNRGVGGYFGHAPVGKSTVERFEAPIGFLGKIMLIIQAILNTIASYTDEQQSRKRFKQQRAYSSTRDKTERILRTLMPEMVVQDLSRNPEITPSHAFLRATVAQSDLCGFTQLSSTKTPEQVVGFMMELFGRFDVLTDKYGIYKVETVGDAYIAGMAEKPLTNENSPILVVLFSLDMVREVDKWAKQQGGIGVTCRVGVAHGRCLGGIVGDTMQRYHLFGPLLTQMEILESTAPEGRVQVSQALKNEIDAQRADGALSSAELQEKVDFELREGELCTSKGEVHADDSVRGRPYVVTSDKPLRCED
ncbi:unnamed protein product [Prorocentrum cordatum]|uniref:Guanylate cyclase domain-containing protein n=1 Tax=Prorocentrum cordatum TaxID=2364126 RepID=A0ABN9TF91_9DINO|nr:unnamed protein product [Polarella glacialis]